VLSRDPLGPTNDAIEDTPDILESFSKRYLLFSNIYETLEILEMPLIRQRLTNMETE
jgi:hypothetical protein